MATFPISDLRITGASTSTTSNNVLLASAGTGGLDVSGYRSLYIQITPTGTLSAGAITFEGSEDGTNYVSMAMYDVNSQTSNPVGSYTVATGASRYFRGPSHWKFFRARISTAFVGGGSVVAYTVASPVTFVSHVINVAQQTAGNLNVTAAGTVGLSANSVIIPVPSAAQGYATYHKLIAAATTNATSVKGSAGTIGMLHVTNVSAAVKYFKIYNKASAPVVGTDVPVFSFPIPAGADVPIDVPAMGLRMSTGIAYAITGAAPDADTTALTAGDVHVNMTYI